MKIALLIIILVLIAVIVVCYMFNENNKFDYEQHSASFGLPVGTLSEGYIYIPNVANISIKDYFKIKALENLEGR